MRSHWLLAFTLLVAGFCPAQSAVPYVNPVIPTSSQQVELADPFVLKWNGEYYLYTSGDPITVYRSEDLVTWRYAGAVLSASTTATAWNQAEIWAPEVVYRNGLFHLYYTATLKSDDWRVSEMGRRVGVAVGKTPLGPFVDSGKPVSAGWAIDGHVFRDPETGREFLFYSYLYEPRLPGAGIVADPLVAWNMAAGAPANVTRGSEAWEDKDGDPGNGSLRYTNEAPTVLKRNGKYYMMYSGGSWDLPTYALSYASSDSSPQGGLAGKDWTKAPAPILRSTPLVDAPGHNAVTKAPNNVDDINIYHARTIAFVEPWNRMPFVDRLYWNHDRMFTQPPSLGRMTPPDQPLFRDNFNRGDGVLGQSWDSIGDWRITGMQARQQDRKKPASAVAKTEPLVYFVAEANVRLAAPLAAATSAGVRLQLSPREGIDVMLTGDGSLLIKGRLADASVPEIRRKLPDAFDPSVYHQLLVTRNADRISVAVDEVNHFQGEFKLGQTPSRIALVTQGAAAEFDGVAVTAYYEDAFEQPELAWETPSGTWLTEQGAMHQVAAVKQPAIALKGTHAEHYEFSASVLWRDGDSLDSKAGIVAAATESGELVLAGYDKNLWPFARFWVQRLTGDKVVESYAARLPRGFQYDEYHTIRSVKHGSAFTFYLDGVEIATARFRVGAARPGVFTSGARAGFDDARFKRLGTAPNLLLDGSFESEQWDGGQPIIGNAWTLSGDARANFCCAHTGLRRLAFRSKGGAAQQTITGLAPGSYLLFGSTTGSAGAELSVTTAAGALSSKQLIQTAEQWREFRFGFEVPAGAESVQITLSTPALGEKIVAVDDLYLVNAGQAGSVNKVHDTGLQSKPIEER